MDPLNEKMRCFNCNQSFELHMPGPHSGMCDPEYLHCDSCANSRETDVWASVKPSECECGGHYSRHAAQRCPSCEEILTHENCVDELLTDFNRETYVWVDLHKKILAKERFEYFRS